MKKQFQGIHDRFLRDHEFRIPMIEHRDDKVCRRWMILQIKIVTIWENKCKNKFWFHLHKQDSNTMPLRNRSDSKQALSTLERLQQEAGEEPYVPIYSYKHKQWQLAQSSVHFLHGGIGKVHGGLLIIPKVKEETSRVFNERRDTLFIALWRKPSEMAFSNSLILLKIDRLQLSAVYCIRRGVWKQHLKWPVFAMWNMQEFGYRWELTITEYSLTTSAKSERKNCTFGVASALSNRATPMTTWPPRPRALSTQRTWISTREWCTRDPMYA